MKTAGQSRVAAIILAAGVASRMGRIKQLLPFRGRPILQHVVDRTRRVAFGQIVLVLGHAAGEISQRLDLEDVQVVINPHYAQGQSTSLRAGLAAVRPHMDAAVFILGDQPLVPAEVFKQLLRVYARTRSAFVIPARGGRRGNPVLVDRAVFTPMAGLRGDVGARVLFDRYREQIQEVEIDHDGIHLDLDTWNDYLRLQVREGDCQREKGVTSGKGECQHGKGIASTEKGLPARKRDCQHGKGIASAGRGLPVREGDCQCGKGIASAGRGLPVREGDCQCGKGVDKSLS